MPSMSDDDDSPFDPLKTPAIGMGVVADMFWKIPGALRCDSPHAFAAMGLKAAAITVEQPVAPPHGMDSPVGRVYEMDGQVLLLGIDHSADTTIHLAEDLAKVPYKTPKYCTILKDGKPMRVDYGETDHCCQNFSLMDAWLEDKGLQKRGRVGQAEARLAASKDIVAAALEHLRKDPLIFLHAQGEGCEQCDGARASIKP
jgi:aminoglycoside 3-N-acetyltransferase